MEKIQACAEFIEQSPTAFQTVETIRTRLLQQGFMELHENQRWTLQRQGKYFTTRNHSSLIAFTLPAEIQELTYNICASHSDVCSFKIKPESVLNRGGYVRLNTEGYGGMLCSTWLDRPLSIAGRAMIRCGSTLKEQLFDLKEPCCLIPNVAIHMNRQANEGMSWNKQIDLLPLIGMDAEKFDFKAFLSKRLGCLQKELVYVDGYLYNPQKCVVWGENKEFFSGPRLDDLEMAFASLQGFLESTNERSINVFGCFDNEEVGSRTRQGAASTFLADCLTRIALALGIQGEDYFAALARSLMVSCDNAHAVHPNHPEKADELNRPMPGKGIVIKFNAAQSYTSDAFSAAYFESLCKEAGVLTQTFCNRSDLVGGGTLGNISASQVSVPSVDVGLAQLAMHSTFETGATADIGYAIEALRAFFDHTIRMDGSGTLVFSK